MSRRRSASWSLHASAHNLFGVSEERLGAMFVAVAVMALVGLYVAHERDARVTRVEKNVLL